MKDKGVSCVCVDMVEHEKISKEIEEYHQVNLENYEQLQFKREFDYIILQMLLSTSEMLQVS